MRYETAREILSEAIEQFNEGDLLQRLASPEDNVFLTPPTFVPGTGKKEGHKWRDKFKPLRDDNPRPRYPKPSPFQRPDFDGQPPTEPEYGDPLYGDPPWGHQPGQPLEIRPPVYSPDGDLIKPAIFPWTKPMDGRRPMQSRPPGRRPLREPPQAPLPDGDVRYPPDAGGMPGPLNPFELERRKKNFELERRDQAERAKKYRDGLNQRPYQSTPSQPRFR